MDIDTTINLPMIGTLLLNAVGLIWFAAQTHFTQKHHALKLEEHAQKHVNHYSHINDHSQRLAALEAVRAHAAH